MTNTKKILRFSVKKIMLQGHKCEHCDKVYHFYCISRKLADLEQDKCPNCSRSMDCSEIIGKLQYN